MKRYAKKLLPVGKDVIEIDSIKVNGVTVVGGGTFQVTAKDEEEGEGYTTAKWIKWENTKLVYPSARLDITL